MAKKVLNKKVALIGSVVFAFFVLGAIAAVLYLNRDPARFVSEGDAAVIAAREASDEVKRAEEYKTAERNYGEAYGLSKTDGGKVEALFKLVDLYIETDRWAEVTKRWNNIVRIQPDNVRARFGRLKYVYIMADSGLGQAWNEVASQATELLEVAEGSGVLGEDTARWDPFLSGEEGSGSLRLGAYLYLLRGRANFEIAKSGASTDREELLAKSMEDLRKVRELEPSSVEACQHMALAILSRGEILASKGDFAAKDAAVEEVQKYLEQAIGVVGDNAKLEVMLLSIKLSAAQRGKADVIQHHVMSFEPEYALLTEKFPSSAEAFSASANFYRMTLATLDKAIDSGERAMELGGDEVSYIRNGASLYYGRYCIYGSRPDLDKAIGLAEKALTLRDAQDKPGPRQWANRMNRVLLFTFLAECYIEQILDPKVAITDVQRESLLVQAEEVVHQIRELLGTGDAPQAVKWQGLLELALGNRGSAVKDMYNAYEQFKSVERKDSLLSYRLAKVFENTSEIGAVKEFLESALRRPDRVDERKPYALLDYADVLLRLGDYNGTLSVADFFERKYWADARSKRTRMRAYIQGGQFKDVEEELAKGDPDDPNIIKLRVLLLTAKIRQDQRAIARQRMQERSPAFLQELESPEETATGPADSVQALTDELRTYWAELAVSLEKLLMSEPNSVRETSIVAVCNNYMTEGKAASAMVLVDKYLEHSPGSTAALFYKALLSEAERGKVSQERRREIEEQVLSQIADPVQRGINLGKYYRGHDEPEKAVAEFEKVFDMEALVEDTGNGVRVQREEPNDIHRLAASYLFEIAISQKDWSLASKIQGVARRQDMDQCEGNFFAARLALVRAAATDNEQLKNEENNAALSAVNRCLAQRPVFSHGFSLRSSVEMALGDTESAIADARKATSLNPLDGSIAKNLAFFLYKRNEGLGESVTAEQEIETKNALVRALRTNPGDLQLLSFYAEYISPRESAKALAIRQHLQKAVPTVQNALLLGRLAMRMAGDETNSETKGALLEIASSSYDEAMALAPEDRRALEAKAGYYRFVGEVDKATKLLDGAGAEELLWVHYLGLNRFEEAKGVLGALYTREPKDVKVLRGLLAVSEQTRDTDGIRRYSSELLSAEDTTENYLLQIQTYLRSGLIQEAESSLARFKNRHPDEPRSLLLEAWLAMRQGRLEDGLEMANRSLQMDRENAVAWRIRGQVNSLLAKTDQAIDDLKRSKSLSNSPGTRYYLSRAYLQAGRVEDAITELDSAIAGSESMVEGELIGRAPRQLLEQIYLRHGRKAALRRFYDETLEMFSGDVSWHNRAAAFAFSEGDFSRAEQLYKRAMDLWKSKEKAGKGRIDKDEFSVSLDGYLRALVLLAGRPNTPEWKPAELNRVFEEGGMYVGGEFAPVAYYRMAEAKMNLGDRAAAVEYCRSALTKAYVTGPGEALASRILRRMYTLLGADEVVKYCQEKLVTEPDSVAANLAMFDVMKIKGEYNKSLSYIDKCLESVGREDPRSLSFVMNKVSVLTLAYRRTSDNSYLAKAIGEYESLLAEMPNNTVVMNNLAYLLAESGEKLPEALGYAARACELSPNNAGLMDTYAYVLHRNGKNSEADKLLQAAIQLYGQDEALVPADVYEHLGMIKEGLGSTTEAVASYKLALDAGGDDLPDSMRERISSAIKRLSGSE